MGRDDFINYYEVLRVAPGAGAEEIARRFHQLAKRYHPDNAESGNRARFDLLVQAHGVLRDAAKRAEYDKLHEQVVGRRPARAAEPSYSNTVGRDVEMQDKLLAVFYTKRRENIRDPGVPDFEIERIFDCPLEQLEFHLWYLKAKGWIERLDNGMVAITVEGVDHVNAEHQRRATTRLLTDGTQPDDDLD